jgi:hypothetical protein
VLDLLDLLDLLDFFGFWLETILSFPTWNSVSGLNSNKNEHEQSNPHQQVQQLETNCEIHWIGERGFYAVRFPRD